MTIPTWESLQLVSEPTILGCSSVLMENRQKIVDSGRAQNQFEQQIQAFIDRSNRKLQRMEEWYQNRFRTFNSSPNHYDFQMSKSEQRVSCDPYAYHQYSGTNSSSYGGSYGDFTGGFNPTDGGQNYLDSTINAYSYQVPYAYQIDDNNPGFYFVQFCDGSLVSMTAAGLDSLLNCCPDYSETNCSQINFQPLKAPLGGFEMGYDHFETGRSFASNDSTMEGEYLVSEHSEIKEDQVFDKLPPLLPTPNIAANFLVSPLFPLLSIRNQNASKPAYEDEDLPTEDNNEDDKGSENNGRQVLDKSPQLNEIVLPVATPVLGAEITEIHHTSLAFSNCNKYQVFECPQKNKTVLPAEFWSMRTREDEVLSKDKEVPIEIKSDNEENSENEETQVFDKYFQGEKAGLPASIVPLTDEALTKAQNEINWKSFILTELCLSELRGRFSSAINQAMREELNKSERLKVITHRSFKNNFTSWLETIKPVHDKLAYDTMVNRKEALAMVKLKNDETEETKSFQVHIVFNLEELTLNIVVGPPSSLCCDITFAWARQMTVTRYLPVGSVSESNEASEVGVPIALTDLARVSFESDESIQSSFTACFIVRIRILIHACFHWNHIDTLLGTWKMRVLATSFLSCALANSSSRKSDHFLQNHFENLLTIYSSPHPILPLRNSSVYLLSISISLYLSIFLFIYLSSSISLYSPSSEVSHSAKIDSTENFQSSIVSLCSLGLEVDTLVVALSWVVALILRIRFIRCYEEIIDIISPLIILSNIEQFIVAVTSIRQFRGLYRKVIVAYNLGGGTFTESRLEVTNEVLPTVSNIYLGRVGFLEAALKLIKAISVSSTNFEVSFGAGEEYRRVVVAEAFVFWWGEESVFTFDPGKGYGLSSVNAIAGQSLKWNTGYENHDFAYIVIIGELATLDMQSAAYWSGFNRERTTMKVLPVHSLEAMSKRPFWNSFVKSVEACKSKGYVVDSTTFLRGLKKIFIDIEMLVLEALCVFAITLNRETPEANIETQYMARREQTFFHKILLVENIKGSAVSHEVEESVKSFYLSMMVAIAGRKFMDTRSKNKDIPAHVIFSLHYDFVKNEFWKYKLKNSHWDRKLKSAQSHHPFPNFKFSTLRTRLF